MSFTKEQVEAMLQDAMEEEAQNSPLVKHSDDVKAYGTSEGVTKAWDTRGRGRHPNTAPAANQPTETFYHGTVSGILKDVLQNGLSQHPDKKFNISKEYFDGPDRVLIPKGFVYLTKDKSTAEYFAKLKLKYERARPGELIEIPDRLGNCCQEFIKSKDAPEPTDDAFREKASVITLDIPEDKANALESDPDSDPTWKAFKTQGVVPKEFISGIKTYDGTRWASIWNPKTKSLKADSVVRVFLVHYGKVDQLAHALK